MQGWWARNVTPWCCFSLFLMWDFQNSSRDLCCQKMCHSWQARACGKYVVLSFKSIVPVSSQGFCRCAFSPLQTGKQWVTHRCGTRGAGLRRDKPAWSRHVFSTDRRTSLRWVTHFLIDCCKHSIWQKKKWITLLLQISLALFLQSLWELSKAKTNSNIKTLLESCRQEVILNHIMIHKYRSNEIL